jgi:DNA-directed RNA polymerase alpha subunit
MKTIQIKGAPYIVAPEVLSEIVTLREKVGDLNDEVEQHASTVRQQQKVIEKLEQRVEFLNCLEACGVDNWVGYEDAQDMMEGE